MLHAARGLLVGSPSVGDFAKDTEPQGAQGRYSAELSRDWEIWGPNGGYLAAIALRAAGCEAAIARPASFAAHYLRVPAFGAVELEVAALHRGRRSESLRVSMRQGGKAVLEAIVRTAAEAPGLEHDDARAPEVPAPEALYARPSEPPPRFPFWLNFESRWCEPMPWRPERTPEPARYLEWLRFAPRADFGDPFIDAARALVLIDTMVWPAASRRHVQERYQAPSLDLVAWFHRPVEGHEWLLSEAEAPVAQRGLIGGTVRVWGADRELLASGGAQLLCVPAPAP
jgi:acyl-CoA thioesterase